MSKYSLKRKVLHISIEAESGEGTIEYQLREMTAAARDAYLDRQSGRLKLVDGKPSGIVKMSGLQADLISCCLFDSTGKNVSIEEVQTWPSQMVTDIFKQAQKLNGLNLEEGEGVTPKNE